MSSKNKIRSFEELSGLTTFEERFEYLSLQGVVGETTFGFDRYLNQRLYRSSEWLTIRDAVIIRDNGCDLCIADRPILGSIFIHHMNPITAEDITKVNKVIFDPNFLICVSYKTHLAIHYGNKDLLAKGPVVRRPNDTVPWKRS